MFSPTNFSNTGQSIKYYSLSRVIQLAFNYLSLKKKHEYVTIFNYLLFFLKKKEIYSSKLFNMYNVYGKLENNFTIYYQTDMKI